MASVVSNLHEAQTNLSELMERAAAGDEVIIPENGIPRARLVPLAPATTQRTPGGWEGRAHIADDFDAPLPQELLAAFGA